MLRSDKHVVERNLLTDDVSSPW